MNIIEKLDGISRKLNEISNNLIVMPIKNQAVIEVHGKIVKLGFHVEDLIDELINEGDNGELRPCPFCGDKVKMVRDKRWISAWLDHPIEAWHVECENADCVIYQVDNNCHPAREKAIEMWNRRLG